VQLQAAACEGAGATAYAITICYRSAVTPAQRQAFVDAAARWGRVITSDLPDVRADIPEGACAAGSPSLATTIDDLLIFASVESIDGLGGVLGSAGWCFRRTDGLPVIGAMRFDVADVINLEGSDQLGQLILHEMGHVLGFGTLWTQAGLLHNPSTTSARADTYFAGGNAIEAFDAAGGKTYADGPKVPVENLGGASTINGHWRKTVMDNELMTGFLSAGSTPLSSITIRSLADIGYIVDQAAADPFVLSLATSGSYAPRASAILLQYDILQGPRWMIDRFGRATRIR
jgi:hypothetical protein